MTQPTQQAIPEPKKVKRSKSRGYGMVLIISFLILSVTLATTLNMSFSPGLFSSGSKIALNRGALDEAFAQVETDIRSKLNSLQTVDNTYTYSGTISMPNDPANMGGASSNIATYTASAKVRGNLYLVTLTVTTTGSNTVFSSTRLLQLDRTEPPVTMVSGATAAYGLRKLRTAYNGNAIRIRRSSDNSERNIGFLPNGDLDVPAIQAFLNNDITYDTLPLDAVTGAAAAYGLRKLDKDYAGFAIRVRRNADNTEKDIGFTGYGDLDLGDLSDFCKTSSCSVKTWYDQSGNARNATQTTAAYQPRIVSSGVIDLYNKRPTLVSDDNTVMTTTANVQNLIAANDKDTTVITAINTVNYTSEQVLFYAAGADGTTYSANLPTTNQNSAFNMGDPNLPNGRVPGDGSWNPAAVASFQRSANILSLWNNSSLIGRGEDQIGSTFTSTTQNISLLGGTGQVSFHGNVSEMIFYPSALSDANRQTIERSIQRYYGIMPAALPQRFVDGVISVSTPSVVYGLRKIISGYTGPLIQVRRSSDNTSADINSTSYNDLDLEQLRSFCGSSSCFVRTWYDQIGTAQNATQLTAANQPRLVNAGTIEMQNGRPTVRFVATSNHFLSISSTPFTAATGTFCGVYRPLTSNAAGIFDFNGTSPTRSVSIAANGVVTVNPGTGALTLNNTVDTAKLSQNCFLQSSSSNLGYAFYNGDWVSGTMASILLSPAATNLWIGRSTSGTTPYLDGYISELVFYPEVLADGYRRNLQSFQMKFFNQPVGIEAFVTTVYDQSGNGRHLTQSAEWLQPTLRLSPTPSLYFDGVDDHMASANTLSITTSQFSALSVAKLIDGTNSYARLVSITNNSDSEDHLTLASAVLYCLDGTASRLASYRLNARRGYNDLTSVTNSGTNEVFQATSLQNGTTSTMRVNGVNNGTTAASTGNLVVNQIWVGANKSRHENDFWYGDIYEVVLYNTALTATQYQAVEREQRSYWGIP